jgi:hypothetical protein
MSIPDGIYIGLMLITLAMKQGHQGTVRQGLWATSSSHATGYIPLTYVDEILRTVKDTITLKILK